MPSEESPPFPVPASADDATQPLPLGVPAGDLPLDATQPLSLSEMLGAPARNPLDDTQPLLLGVPPYNSTVWEEDNDDHATRPGRRQRIVALVPAHNEETGIARTIASLLAQDRPLDDIIIIANGCTDRTAQIARQFPVTVLELPFLKHRKAQALNTAWQQYARDAGIVIGLDGDSELPPFAVGAWEREFSADDHLGGSSSQPVMTGNSFLSRMQRAEFAKTATITLRRGGVSVISGTGCAFRGEALREAALIPAQHGPWTYESAVEDYFLTYQLRRLGWRCVMSPSVWCFTGSMKTLKSLWYQRIKWQYGTVGDLVRFGFTRLNWREWCTQGFGLLCIAFWILWPALNIAEAAKGHLDANWTWLLFPLFFSVTEMLHAAKIRGRDWVDFLIAGSLASAVVYSFLAMGWVSVSWWKLTRNHLGDLWTAQYTGETADYAAEETLPELEGEIA
jgi:cellulose synthase/poly-beta-1,6-N-acetylglucosamine synthase-like glycosyltransferase